MKLEFESKYLSIDRFYPVEMPDFAVLTGVNGSGKSHLLEAIEKGNVKIAGLGQGKIVLFSYATFQLDKEASFNAHGITAEIEAAWKLYDTQVRRAAKQWREQLGESRYIRLRTQCERKGIALWDLEAPEVEPYKENVRNHFRNMDQKNGAGLLSLLMTVPYMADGIEHDEFVRRYKPFRFKNDFLPHQLGKVFWDYYVKYRNNQVNEFQNERNGKSYPVLSEEEFVRTHGGKPWELVGQILKTFDTLHYEINSPEGLDVFGTYKLGLKHLEKGVEIDFNNLSSGEKVMMALVASVYKSSSDKHFPNVLLLDEIDGSLHPSMIKNMLAVIEQVFLQHGVKVILVTHSPTTIALAPEASVFVVNKSGLNRVEKKSKQEALRILTQGFATLDQGLKLLDEVANSGLTIITEGRNTNLISLALRIYKIKGVEVLSGVEGASGKTQLRTMFDFFSKARHENKVLFVWDCDVTSELREINNTFPFVMPLNTSNTVAKKGIENMFPQELFREFSKTVTMSLGKTITEFDETRKVDFERFIIARNNPDDFKHFAALEFEIRRIQSSS